MILSQLKAFLFPVLQLPFVGWAVAGSAVIGAIASDSASSKQAKASANATAAQKEAAEAQNKIAQQQQDIANQQWNRYQTTVAPVEDKFIADSQQTDTPGAYARAAGEAQGQSMDQYGLARARLDRTPGLDKSSAAYTAGLTNIGLATAATSAGLQNTARKTVRDQAWARKIDALSLGKGMAANASTGLANAASGMSASASTMGSMAAAQMQNANASANRAYSTATGLGGMAADGIRAWSAGQGAQGISPLQSLNRQFTTTDAPWSESASVLGPDGAMN
jgi:hypothetical protein